jgi:cold shock CspA family protein
MKSMTEYKVLWFDDQHESFDSLKDDARQQGINLIGFTNAEEGIAELESNLLSYDAVIVDGKFYKSAQASGDAVNDSALFNVARYLDRIENIKKIPWFIFSGQPDFLNKSNPIAAEYKGDKVYNKNFDADIEQLWIDIKKEADQQIDTQIRHQYHRVFEVCTEKYIGEHAGLDLLNLLKVEDNDHIENYFNTIRKIVEDLFMAFYKFDLLPSEFIKPQVALNPSSIFLSGLLQSDKTNTIYKQHKHLEETHLPKQISIFLKNILDLTQAGSHRSEIDLYVKTVKTPYLFKSVIFQLLDVLIWFKMHIDAGPKTRNWVKIDSAIEFPEREIELIPGKVINVHPQKGYAFLKPDAKGENVFIPPNLVSNHSLIEGMSIKVEIEDYKDNRTDELKNKVKRILF